MFDFHAHTGEDNSDSFISILSDEEIKAINPCSSIGRLSWLYDKIEITRIEELLRENKNLAVGEIGLDKTKGEMKDQIDDFTNLLDIAKTYERTVIIHSVRTNSEVLKILKERKIKKAIFHGYTSSYEEAFEIEKNGYLISLGPRSFKTRDIKKLLNLDFVLESDMKTGPIQKKTISELYLKASGIIKHDIKDKVESFRSYIWQENFYA